jgi:plasmid stability protein
MATQTLTLHLPDGLYARLQQRAQQSHRSLEAELLDVLSHAIPGHDGLPHSLSVELAQLDTMNDAELSRAAKSRLAKKAAARLVALHVKRQREGLSESEAQVLAELVGQYERSMLFRARAAAILKERGHNLSGLAAAT